MTSLNLGGGDADVPFRVVLLTFSSGHVAFKHSLSGVSVPYLTYLVLEVFLVSEIFGIFV